MKRLFIVIAAILLSVCVYAQSDAQKAAAEAAKALTEAPKSEKKADKPKYWTKSLKTQINFGQAGLANWAAGGDNTISLAGYIDANGNYKKDAIFWNNRLQLDYGFVYASSKPILQKSTDRIYFESSWGYQAKKSLYASANYNFRSQFSNTFSYPTPNKKANGDSFEEGYEPVREDWLAAKTLSSGFLAPAYTNLALGIDWKPAKWISANLAPLTGGFVIVKDENLRKKYGMALKKEYKDMDVASLSETQKAEYDAAVASGMAYKGSKFEFGAQLKVNFAVNVNTNFSYTSQVVLFSNYLDKPLNMRVNWDNRFDWKLAKYFSLTLVTNLIYDENVMIKNEKDIEQYPNGRARVQFKESIAFGFTWTIAK